MNLSKRERIAVANALMEIASADGEITFGEVAYKLHISEQLNISSEESSQAIYMDYDDNISILKNIREEDKKRLSEILRDMIFADGKEHKSERELYLKMCTLSELPIM